MERGAGHLPDILDIIDGVFERRLFFFLGLLLFSSLFLWLILLVF